MNAITTVDIESEISRSLYRYIFHRVVNRPHAEHRHNIHLDPISTYSCLNSFSFDGSFYQLPYSGSWFVFLVDNRHVHHVRLPQDKEAFTCLADRYVLSKLTEGYCSKHHIDFRIVSSNTGKAIPRRYVYVTAISDQKFLFMISEKAVVSCGIPASTTPDDLWLNIYYHHDSEFKVRDYTSIDSSWDNKFCSIYQNGCYLVNSQNLTESLIQDNDLLEVTYDPDIVGYFDVPVKTDYNSNGYHTLFHVPHELNPDDDIISHAVCDIVLYRDDGTDNVKKGVLLSRARTTKYVQTLTHNDFGISTGFLSNYGDLPNDGGRLTARVIVRNHHRKDLKLPRDANYTNCLYQLDDDTIIKHLRGELNVPCWTAVELSKSAYAKVLENDYFEITKETLKDSIGALGYATAADVIGKRVYHIPVVPGIDQSFTINLSPSYVQCDDLIAHVYIDGFMIDNEHIQYKKIGNFLRINIDPRIKIGPYGCDLKSYEQYWNDLECKETSYFTVEVFEHTPYRAKKVTIPVGASATVVIDQDYLAYREVPVTEKNKLQNTTIFNRYNPQYLYNEFTHAEYSKIKDEEIEGPYRKLTIKNNLKVEETVLIVSKHAYAKICGVEHQLKEMNYDIFATHILTVDALEFPDLVEDPYEGEIIEETSNYIRIPYLNKNQECLAYLNHRELTPDLDYKMYTVSSSNGYQYAGQIAIFQNVDYLTVANNIFEIFTISESKIVSTNGFLTDGSPTLEGYLASYGNIGILFTDGRAYSHVPSTMVGMYDTDLHQSIRKGAEAKIRAFIPYRLKTVFDQYATFETATLKTVLDYMSSINIDIESPAILERSHHIYSVFMQTITELVLRGKLKYNIDWSDDIIKTRLKQYEDIIPYDIAMSQNNIEVTDPLKFIEPPKSGLDYRFVDVLPTYRLDMQDSDLIVKDEYPTMQISGASQDDINGTYICMNSDLSFVRPGERYCVHTESRVYPNLASDSDRFNDQTQQIWENGKGCMISHIGPYWVLLDSHDVLYARALDPNGYKNIWEIEWEPLQGDTFSISTTEIEIHTAGEFPARRIAYTTNINDRNFLTKVARLYLNKDLVQDGVNP